MAGESLGTIRGQMILDVKQALAAYTSARQAHVSTVTALQTGAGAMMTAGAAVAGAGAVMVGGFLAAVNAAGEFERKLDYFVAVSGPDAAKQYDAVRAKAIKLGADTIYSADQIADSFVELGKAGVSATDIINGVGEGVAALGAAADIPLDTAANIITAAVQTFGLSADQAVDVANKLAGAANASIVDVQDLGVAMKYTGGVANVLGLQFGDVNTALALLGKAGIKGSTAGTSLRQTLTSLNGATPGATAALKDLGIITEDGTNKFYNMNGSLKPLPQVFQILQDSMKGLTAEQQVSTIKTIFQQRAISTVATLAKAGAAGFAEMTGEIEKTTALDVASKRLDNLSGDIEILKGNIDTLVLSAGSGFQSVARSIVQSITDIVQAFINLPPNVQTGILGTVAAVGGLLVVIGTLGMFSGAVLNIIGLAIRLGPAFTAMGAAINGLAKAFVALNIAMAQNWFVRILAIIGALVTGFIILYNTNEQFRAAVQPIWQAIMNIFMQLGPIIQNVMTWLGTFLSGLTGQAVSAGTGFVAMLSSLASTLGGTLSTAIQTILPPLLQFVQTVLTGLMPVISALLPLIIALAQLIGGILSGNLQALPALIQNVFTQFTSFIGVIAGYVIPGIIQFVTTIVTTLIGMLPTIIQGAVTLFTGLVTALAQIIPLVVGAVLQLVLMIITALVNALPTLITAFIGGLTQLITAITAMLPQILTAVVSIITALATALPQIIIQLINAVVALLPALITALVGLLPTLINAAITLFTGLITGLLTALPQVITALLEALPQIFQTLIDAIPLLINAAIQLFLGIIIALATAIPQIIVAVIGLIPKIITALINAIPQLIMAAIQLFLGLVTGLAKAIPQIITAVIGMIPQIVKALIDAVPQLLKAGVQLIQGLINGIGSMANALWQAAQNIAAKAINAIKSFFGIKSPSRVMAGIGVFLIQGLNNGITSMTRSAVNTMTGLANAVASVPFGISGLEDTANSIAVSKQLALSNATIGVEQQKQTMDNIEKALQAIAEKDTVHVEELNINNPEPEPASESLPDTIRKMADV